MISWVIDVLMDVQKIIGGGGDHLCETINNGVRAIIHYVFFARVFGGFASILGFFLQYLP